MTQNSKPGVITEQEARQLEQGLEDTRSSRLGTFTVMMQADSDIHEAMKDDPLYACGSLAHPRDALEACRRGTGLIKIGVSRLKGMRG